MPSMDNVSRMRRMRATALRVTAFALAAVAFAALGQMALAKEIMTIKQGMEACVAWCEKKNKTPHSIGKCRRSCERYWACNGSDSTAETCQAVPPEASRQLPEGMEDNTDRPGSDFGSFTVSPGSPAVCQNACRKDTRCKAWTYVRPRIQGPSAVCYLKNAMPPATPNKCCISGVVPRGPVGVSPNLPPPASQN
jgi:hypothetical protein